MVHSFGGIAIFSPQLLRTQRSAFDILDLVWWGLHNHVVARAMFFARSNLIYYAGGCFVGKNALLATT